MKRIHWRALTNLKADGYSYAAMNLSSRLQDLNLVDREDTLFAGKEIVKSVSITPDGVINFIPEPTDVDILINNCLPMDYSFDGKYIVGFTYWETTQLPDSWVEQMNKCDEIWTTSEWAKYVFIDSGVDKPVYSFELGVDSKVFQYVKRHKCRPFTFIHVGSPSTRKNTQLVVDAFLKMYEGNEDYKLIIKSNGPPDARIIKNGVNLGGIYNVPNIEVIDEYLTDEELSDLFGRSHCMVYPTRGEGWGMAPFQAIATGLPTICTNQTGCFEFAHLSVPLSAEMTDTNQFGIYSVGQWANPKIEDVCDKMLYVVNNYDQVLAKTRQGAQVISKRYSWNNVISRYMDRLIRIMCNE